MPIPPLLTQPLPYQPDYFRKTLSGVSSVAYALLTISVRKLALRPALLDEAKPHENTRARSRVVDSVTGRVAVSDRLQPVGDRPAPALPPPAKAATKRKRPAVAARGGKRAAKRGRKS